MTIEPLTLNVPDAVQADFDDGAIGEMWRHREVKN